uniref:Uncharacterized protein n=1 Tax=Arundo donax TaxID=35708 RepID=A0A0A9DJK8_ARUDO
MILEMIVCSTRSPSAMTLVAMSLSVTMPESRPLASVSSTASTRLAAILRHASATVVPSGIVSAFDSRSFLTVLSPVPWLGEAGLGETLPLPLAAAVGSSDLQEDAADGGRLRVRRFGATAALALMTGVKVAVEARRGQ